MDPLHLLIVLCIVGCVLAFVPMDATIRKVIVAIVVVLAVIVVLAMLGIRL